MLKIQQRWHSGWSSGWSKKLGQYLQMVSIEPLRPLARALGAGATMTWAMGVLAGICPVSAQAYYGRHSTEATLTFHGRIETRLGFLPPLSSLNSHTPERKLGLEHVGVQIRHLMGAYQAASFRERFGHAGALGESYQIQFTDVREASTPGYQVLEYDFSGEVVFSKSAFKRGPERSVPVILPLTPDRIYKLGVKRGRNRCTDRDFNSEEDFWYYWDPEQPGCPLAGNDVDVLRLRGKLKALPNTQRTYPEYDRLYGDNGNGAVVEAAAFIGYIRTPNTNRARPNRRDEAWASYRAVIKSLEDEDFELVQRRDHFKIGDRGTFLEGINYLRRYKKKVTTYDRHEIELRLTVLLADTDMDSQDPTFHHYLLPSLHDADLVIYDGHSNLGRNFDLNIMPGAKFNREKYQIFFFNGCSTYPYLNGMYFRAKGGTRNLDVLTAGLPTFSNTTATNIMAFLMPFAQGRAWSYQRLLAELERSNDDMGTSLVGVKGDDDNEWSPPARFDAGL